MDFFGAQDRARRLSGWLVVLFVVAVVLIIVTVYLAAVITLSPDPVAGLWDPGMFLLSAGGVVLVVLGASTVRTSMLRSGGGKTVAEMLGGRLVHADASDPDDRRLRNVVEEMSLAAGTPVPAVYVLENEASINAFAAGYTPEDAVVAVTRGTLDALSRDELQAVVAHEFSHITNRDIRLNIRLTGILFGILALGLGGRMLLRSALYSRGGRRDGKSMGVIVAVGLALFVAGYLGVFFGRIIRAAVSRQREYLADAAAVQFTRQPEAMASTLKKIGVAGSRLDTAAAEEVSHFFFANGLRSGLVSNLWSTHPPLVERIRRLDPEFDGDFSKVVAKRPSPREETAAAGGARGRKGRSHPSIGDTLILAAGAMGAAGVPQAAPEAVPEQAGLDLGEAVSLGSVPDRLLAATREPFAAVALMYAAVLDRDAGSREAQLAALRSSITSALLEEVMKLLPDVDALPEEARLPLADLAAPTLGQLSEAQAEKAAAVLADVARADHKLSIFEFALETTVRHRLRATHGRAGKGGDQSMSQLLPYARVVLAALAHAGSSNPDAARAAYRAGVVGLADEAREERLPACTSDDVRAALEHLAEGTATVRDRVMAACVRTASHDRVIGREERKLLRAIAAALHVTAPAFLPRFDLH